MISPVTRLLAAGLILGLLSGLGGCLSSSRMVNIAKQANLAEATQLDIAELVSGPTTSYEHRLTVTDRSILSQLAGALDSSVPLEPLAECMSQYQLRFTLSTGDVQVLSYYCRAGASFLRGGQAFWSGKQAKPPTRFDELLSALLQGRSS